MVRMATSAYEPGFLAVTLNRCTALFSEISFMTRIGLKTSIPYDSSHVPPGPVKLKKFLKFMSPVMRKGQEKKENEAVEIEKAGAYY